VELIVERRRRAGLIDWRLKKGRNFPQLYYGISRETLFLYFPLLLGDAMDREYVSAHNFEERLVVKRLHAQWIEVKVLLKSIYRVAYSASAALEMPIDYRGIYFEFGSPYPEFDRQKRIED